MDRMANDVGRDSSTKTEFTYPEKIELKRDGVSNVIRMVDYESYQRYMTSWCMCDDGKVRSFIVENDHQPPSILKEIIGNKDDFFRGGILETIKGENGKKAYKWESPEDPELMDIVRFNGDRSNNNGGWKYSPKYAFKAFVRGDPWYAENKKLKVLEMGPMAFEGLLEVRNEFGKNLNEYDIVYKITGKGKMNTKHSINKAGPNNPDKIDGPLSPEEQAYETIDLIRNTKVASANYIIKYLINTIRRIDSIMGTDYAERLEQQAAIETAEWEANNNEGNDTMEEGDASTTPTTPAPSAEAPILNVTPTAQAETATAQAEPAVRSRTLAAASTTMVKCAKCGNDVGEDAVNCPHCQHLLLAPCDVCHKNFSTSATVCPHCGTTYKI